MKNILIICFLCTQMTNAQLFFYDDFNSYSSYTDIYNSYLLGGASDPNSIYVAKHSNQYDLNGPFVADDFVLYNSTEIVSEGLNNKYLKFFFHRLPEATFRHYVNDSIYPTDFVEHRIHMTRNEISTYDNEAVGKSYYSNEEYWFGWKTFIHNEYKLDSIHNPIIMDSINKYDYDLLGQIHLTTSLVGDKYPPFSIRMIGNKWFVTIADDNGSEADSYHYYPLLVNDTVVKEVWNEWKLRVILSEGSNGVIQVWKDGLLVANITGKNTWYDASYYFKLGIYKARWWSHNDDDTPGLAEDKYVSYDDFWIAKDDLTNGLRLVEEDCGRILDASNMSISTYKVVGNTASYKFRFTNPVDSTYFVTNSISRTLNISNLSWFEEGTTYNVLVRVDGHHEFNDYSNSPCTITIPSDLTLSLIDEDCGRILDASNMTISSQPVAGTHSYKFRFTDPTGPPGSNYFVIDSTSPTIDVSSDSRFMDGVTYNVLVRIDGHHFYDNYASSPCQITTPEAMRGVTNLKDSKIKVYPNPFGDNFSLDVGEYKVDSVKLFDLYGKEVNLGIDFKTNRVKISNQILRGVYFLHIFSENTHVIKKVIKN